MTYIDGKKLKIPKVVDERSLFDFTHAILAIDVDMHQPRNTSSTRKPGIWKPF
jgi:hypothetical protein